MKWLLVFAALLIPTTMALACPAFLFIDSFGAKAKAGKRRELNLFVVDPKSPNGWRQLPLQIDPFDASGRLAPQKTDDETWLDADFAPYDRLAFYTKDFASRYKKKDRFPCRADRLFELRSHDHRYGYLAFCRDTELANLQKPQHTITHESKSGEIRSRDYLYRYSPENHLMFNLFAASYDRKFQYPLVIGEDADQYIRGDIKNFFTITFNKKDIDAFLAYETRGPVGLIGSLNFFLKILFFNIDLKLAPEISFYEDLVFMPMVMHLPVDAREYLNPGSGLFYTWKPGRDVLLDIKNSKVPALDVARVKAGFNNLARLGLQYCKTEICRYRILGETGLRYFSLDFNIAKPLVEKGFFPLFMASSGDAADEFGWEVSSRDEKDRVGLYFETSGLPQGNHEWEFLIRFGEKASDMDKLCPAPVTTLSSYGKSNGR